MSITDVKIIALYLPQFYRTKENDMWWGEGYTDWTAVKNAESYFGGHAQPRIPLGKNYYDLSKKETMRWQAGLMKKYEIDGICMYHYWFKDGRRALDQPEKNLLNWTDVDMPFCFSWANEQWMRSWKRVSACNCWSQKFMQNTFTDGDILIKQEYGGKEEWKEHFYYLLPFFKDKRYIRIDNRPVFIFHCTMDISCLDEMVEEWRKLAKQNSLDGLYLLGANTQEWQMDYLDALLLSEPDDALKTLYPAFGKTENKHLTYDQLYSQILMDSYQHQIKTFYQVVSGYDVTPRQGKGSWVVDYVDPDKFKNYLDRLLKKSYRDNNELLFINAWNEWGEGMYLEPDELHKYGYLEAVKNAKAFFNLDRADDVVEKNITQLYNVGIEIRERINNNLIILDKWLYLEQSSFSVGEKIKNLGFTHVAIYGMGVIGRHVYKECKMHSIIIDYIIDKQGNGKDLGEKIYKIEDNLPETELVIISVTYGSESIVHGLKKKGLNCLVIKDLLEI